MLDLDNQLDYWNRIGPEKTFEHPVNVERLNQYLSPGSRIVDFGCGYGRALGVLFEQGYRDLIGFDPAAAMVVMARDRYPQIEFEELTAAPNLPLADAPVDATLLFSILTCVPTDEGQRTIVGEIERVLRPGGLLYISDLWLQTDERNLARYDRDEAKYGRYGVFDLPEGVTVRHHHPKWIEELTANFQTVALEDVDVRTMNGNPAKAFQWFGRKQTSSVPAS